MTPDPSSLASAVPNTTPSNYVEQSSQNAAPQQTAPSAPDVSSLPPNGPRLTSALSRIVGTVQPTPPPAPPARPGWQTALGKVASTVSTGLAGIPDRGRPNFISGLGEGARSEKQA